jgi:hypothetical protein
LQEFRATTAADLDAIASRALDAVAHDDPLPAEATTFLLRRYVASPSADLAAALGTALARALDAAHLARDAIDCAPWLTLLVEASAVADDERILPAAADLVDRLRASWPGDATTTGGFVASASSIEACLRASTILNAAAIVPSAIDELERIVGAGYRPGAGVLGGVLAAHVPAASTLLTAFDVTGRLPYSMLAEELIQPARRIDVADCARDCAAARVLCRLAALHDDGDYRAAAVIAPDADYRADAARILHVHAPRASTAALNEAALYALAFGELTSPPPP